MSYAEGYRGPVDENGYLLPCPPGSPASGSFARDLRGHRIGNIEFIEKHGPSRPGVTTWLVRCHVCMRTYLTILHHYYRSSRVSLTSDAMCNDCRIASQTKPRDGCRWCGRETNTLATVCDACDRRKHRNGSCPSCGRPRYKTKPCACGEKP